MPESNTWPLQTWAWIIVSLFAAANWFTTKDANHSLSTDGGARNLAMYCTDLVIEIAEAQPGGDPEKQEAIASELLERQRAYGFKVPFVQSSVIVDLALTRHADGLAEYHFDDAELVSHVGQFRYWAFIGLADGVSPDKASFVENDLVILAEGLSPIEDRVQRNSDGFVDSLEVSVLRYSLSITLVRKLLAENPPAHLTPAEVGLLENGVFASVAQAGD